VIHYKYTPSPSTDPSDRHKDTTYSSSAQPSQKAETDSPSTLALPVKARLKARWRVLQGEYGGLECRESGRRFGLVGRGAEFDVGPTTDKSP
jgi:hypothetical protein